MKWKLILAMASSLASLIFLTLDTAKALLIKASLWSLMFSSFRQNYRFFSNSRSVHNMTANSPETIWWLILFEIFAVCFCAMNMSSKVQSLDGASSGSCQNHSRQNLQTAFSSRIFLKIISMNFSFMSRENDLLRILLHCSQCKTLHSPEYADFSQITRFALSEKPIHSTGHWSQNKLKGGQCISRVDWNAKLITSRKSGPEVVTLAGLSGFAQGLDFRIADCSHLTLAWCWRAPADVWWYKYKPPSSSNETRCCR